MDNKIKKIKDSIFILICLSLVILYIALVLRTQGKSIKTTESKSSICYEPKTTCEETIKKEMPKYKDKYLQCRIEKWSNTVGDYIQVNYPTKNIDDTDDNICRCDVFSSSKFHQETDGIIEESESLKRVVEYGICAYTEGIGFIETIDYDTKEEFYNKVECK